MLKFIVGVVLAAWAGFACAADAPRFGPPASWVKPTKLSIPAAAGDEAAPVRRLLADVQERFDPKGDEIYTEGAFRLQTTAGLAAGVVTLMWSPGLETLTVHYVHIIRGDQVIDVLAKGQAFTVLRRETNLEMAMLDGKLTATLQPEGLQVGDVLDVAYTLRHQDPVMQGRSEQTVTILPGPATDHFRIRQLWPASDPMKWRTTAGMADPVVTRTPDQVELLLDLTNAERAKAPKGAPIRYSFVSSLETSGFANWSDVSALMAPLYATAATLKPDSPLRAEVAKIKAASNDPKVQAAAALRLVQDQTRYLYLGMNLGGYVPADADTTWARRFGDCKGKTALLLALLKELGIDAEPAMVNSVFGDGMNEHLPLLEFFDHILVRAHIGGKTYWLDGTRSGDRGLDDLQVPNFHWALPVQASGAVLEALTVPPLDKPTTETHISLDASGGLTALAPAHIEMVYRGDGARAVHIGLSAVAKSDAEQVLKDQLTKAYPWIEFSKIGFDFAEASQEERVTADGAASMAWNLDSDSGAREYETDETSLGWTPDFKRDPGEDQTAPFAVTYPAYTISTETIILPQKGVGFSIVGDDVDKTIGQIAFKRTTHVDKGVFSAETSVKALAPEFPAADAPAIKIAMRDLSGVTVYVRAPQTYAQSDQEVAVRLARTPTTAGEFADRGDARTWAGQYAPAMADFDSAIKLKPDDAGMLNYRCFGRALANKDLDQALADCNAALDLDAHNAQILDSRGFVFFRQGLLDKSLADLDATLKLIPSQAPTLYVRGIVQRKRGNTARGDADIAAAKAIDPSVPAYYEHFGVRP